jgi:hypothetical protein
MEIVFLLARNEPQSLHHDQNMSGNHGSDRQRQAEV